MASGLFTIVVLIFILRGVFLGLSGVIGRLIGFLLGFYCVYHYRSNVANFIEQHTAINLAPAILELICGISIFIGTVLITGLLVSLAFKLLATIIPALKQLADTKSGPAMVTGAMVNGCLGAAIALVVMWGIGLASNKTAAGSPLQLFANQFGSTVFSWVSDSADINIQTSSYSLSTQSQKHSEQIYHSSNAIITSSSNPKKTISIEPLEQPLTKTAANQAANFDPSSLLANEQIQSLLNNSELRNTLMQQLQNNPEKLQQLLDNPQLQELLKNYPSTPTKP